MYKNGRRHVEAMIDSRTEDFEEAFCDEHLTYDDMAETLCFLISAIGSPEYEERLVDLIHDMVRDYADETC